MSEGFTTFMFLALIFWLFLINDNLFNILKEIRVIRQYISWIYKDLQKEEDED